MATAKKADLKVKSTNFTGDDGKLIYPRAHYDHLDGKPTSYTPTAHTHTRDEIEGLIIPAAQVAVNWNSTSGITAILNKPSWIGSSKPTYTSGEVGAAPLSHSHSISNVTGLQTALNGKAPSTHPHSVATIDAPGFMSSVDKAKLDGIAAGAQVNVGTNLSQGARGTTTLRIDSSTGSNLTLPAVTTSLAGLMTSTDKTRLDVLHSLLEEDTENNVVDSINEVLSIFNNYPEGADLVTALAGKVDKVTGKGLSTNDYTTTEKNKLSGIETGAQVNVATNLSQGARDANSLRIDSSTGNNVTLPAVTDLLAGLMTSSDKTKLNGITAGAQVNRAIATTTQAQAGENNTSVMTPLRVKESVTANARSNTWTPTWSEVSDKPTFATVATSGSYNDLSNKPSIPSIPSVMGTNEGNIGSATTQRTINAANLKSIILKHSPAGSRPASDVSSWAKASSKPSYTASEVGAVPTSRTINGKALSTNITLTASDVGAGTSNLTIGTTSSTAKAGNYQPTWSQVTSKPTNIIRQVSFSGGTMVIEVI